MTAAEQRHYGMLVGRTIVGLVEDPYPNEDRADIGFKLDNGKVVWIMCDPECNGPGFLDIQ